MARCIELAKNGLGTTYPNPLVGSVIVLDNMIIGEGWHYQAGSPHAEVNAIHSVTNKNLLSKATIYVSLEPCSHFGKTPPCADLIVKSGIKNVVIGTRDPNPKVAGKGIEKLIKAGCNLVENVLQKECIELNKRFFTFQLKKRPYIFLKWAQTEDGFIAPISKNKKEPVWITHSLSRQWAHKMRSEEQSILVGTNTVLEDNPSLTTRHWKGNSPMRAVIDRTLKIDTDHTVYDSNGTTLCITEQEKPNEVHAFFETIDFSKAIALQICDVLYRYNLQSVIIEGGTKTLQTFIDEQLWDEAFVFTSKTKFHQGIEAPKLLGTLIAKSNISENMLLHYKNSPS